jgi:hypothetical protein
MPGRPSRPPYIGWAAREKEAFSLLFLSIRVDRAGLVVRLGLARKSRQKDWTGNTIHLFKAVVFTLS